MTDTTARAMYVAAVVNPKAADRVARDLASVAEGLMLDRVGAVDEYSRQPDSHVIEGTIDGLSFGAELLHQTMIEELLGLRRAVLELGAIHASGVRLRNRAGDHPLAALAAEATIRANVGEQGNKLAWLLETSTRVAAVRREQLLAGARPANLLALRALHDLPKFVLQAIEAGQRPEKTNAT